MAVVPLTLTISLCLVFTFVLFFWREHSRSRFGGTESEALLPLSEENARSQTVQTIDLANRLPAKRRGGCGGHHHESHKPCAGCVRGDGSCHSHS